MSPPAAFTKTKRRANNVKEALVFCSEWSVAVVGLPESLEEVGTHRHDGVGVERRVGRVVVFLPREKPGSAGVGASTFFEIINIKNIWGGGGLVGGKE